jgi:hypothetical protein
MSRAIGSGLEVTDESAQDDQVQQHCDEEHPTYLPPGDGAYDRNEIFNLLEKQGTRSGIKTRSDAATHSTRSPYHAECVGDRTRLSEYQV